MTRTSSFPVASAALGVVILVTAPEALAQHSPQPEPSPSITEAGRAGEPEANDPPEEEIVVQATRSRRLVQDEPIRVEVITREEIEEKTMMQPGAIAMLVSETGGVRVQVTSPALGAANIRIQGLEGRYTQLLTDGLPLYGGQALGLLQVPPTDLGRVEVIKGAASALYGGSALGGVINLVSRRPGDDPEREILVNATSQNGQDYTGYLDGRFGDNSSGSLTAGYHRQSPQDLDSDRWLDVARYERWTARPRLFWDGDNGASVYFTLGAMQERRVGGTALGGTVSDGQSFRQSQETRRLDAGLKAELPIEGLGILGFRGATMRQDHDHVFGAVFEKDFHQTALLETSLDGKVGDTNWLFGLAYQEDKFRSEAFSQFDYTYRVPGVFVQVEHDVGEDVVLAASARYDDHSVFGGQFSPRLSMLYRPGLWRVRASIGQGYFAPTPFVEAIDAAGLSRLEPLRELKAETATTASVDLGWASGPLEWSATLFASRLENPAELVPFASAPGGPLDRVRLTNFLGETRVQGIELLVRYKWDAFKITGNYVYADATEGEPSGLGRRDAPLTPRHSANLIAMWEDDERGRVGLELLYTGEQELENNPFRKTSRPYVLVGVLGEMKLGAASLFLNAENILDVRQTKYDRLVLPQRAPDGQWTTDVWAPTEGFVLSAGVRLRF